MFTSVGQQSLNFTCQVSGQMFKTLQPLQKGKGIIYHYGPQQSCMSGSYAF